MNQVSGIERFVERFPADADVQRPDAVFLDYASDHAPAELVDLWHDHGIGFYGEQRVAVVDPAEWQPALQEWLGRSVASFPIAVTSFGHIYHTDHSGTVQVLDPHFQTNEIVARSIDEFFGEHLVGPASHVADLEGPRGGGRQQFGDLAEGECYYFEPPLALGGQVRPDTLAKGDGVDYVVGVHRAMLTGSR